MQRILLAALLCLHIPAFAGGMGGKPLSPAAEVGKHLFFDKHLSGSGQMACSTCHDPNHAYGPPNDLPVQPGGPRLTDHGVRAVPSLRYQEFTPAYSDMLDNPDGISRPGPGGGLTLDGRAATLATQASIPLLAANEMANHDAADVVRKIEQSDYAALFRAAFGSDIFNSPPHAFAKAGEALQAFQMEDTSFHPFTSKYDRLASNKIGGTLTPEEQRGFAVFANPDKGNCFACHYNGPGLGGSSGLFTDFTYSAIGVPRNPEIPANEHKSYHDMGICSRVDHPLPDSAHYCGMFKTPSLRNVSTRRVFFHNGRFKTLHDVIRFYNTRDTNPELWYPVVHGVPQKFNDLPTQYHANIDTQMPLDGRARGSAPPMTEQEMEDLEAFLNTLTDEDQLQAAEERPATSLRTMRSVLCRLHPALPIALMLIHPLSDGLVFGLSVLVDRVDHVLQTVTSHDPIPIREGAPDSADSTSDTLTHSARRRDLDALVWCRFVEEG